MPEIPKDPRELARAILSGKISIEDVAREQARRRGQAAPPGADVPPPREARVPIPPPVRQAEVDLRMPPIPVPPPQQRPQQQRPRPKQQRPQQRPVQRQPVQPPKRPLPTDDEYTPSLRDPDIQSSIKPAEATAGPTPARGGPRLTVRNLRATMRNRQALRNAIVLSEILGKPLALRDEP